jgi:hypothetical protein
METHNDDLKVSPKWIERQKQITAQLAEENIALKKTITQQREEIVTLTQQLNLLRAQINQPSQRGDRISYD